MAARSDKPAVQANANTAAPPSPSKDTPRKLPALTPDEARQCQFSDCDAGTAVVTASKKDGIFFSCETEALADYTNAVLGFLSMAKTMTGRMPNIDPQTGEPQYQGETKIMLDDLRGKAGVATFDAAVAHCQYGPYRHHVTVMNYRKDGQSTWVADSASKKSIWLPTSEIERPPR